MWRSITVSYCLQGRPLLDICGTDILLSKPFREDESQTHYILLFNASHNMHFYKEFDTLCCKTVLVMNRQHSNKVNDCYSYLTHLYTFYSYIHKMNAQDRRKMLYLGYLSNSLYEIDLNSQK